MNKEELNELKKKVLNKLCSRKFWVALLGFIGALGAVIGLPEMTAEQATAIAAGCASLAAYIIGEGLVDRASLSENSGTNIENEK
jgi:hypothetical protein